MCGGCRGAGEDARAPGRMPWHLGGRMLSRLGWFPHIWEGTWEDAGASVRELLRINTKRKKKSAGPSHPCPPPSPTRASPLPSPVPAASSRSLRHPLAAAGGSAKPGGGAAKGSARTHPHAVTPPKAPRVTRSALAHAAEGEKPPANGPRPAPETSSLRNRLSARCVRHAGDYGPGCPG